MKAFKKGSKSEFEPRLRKGIDTFHGLACQQLPSAHTGFQDSGLGRRKLHETVLKDSMFRKGCESESLVKIEG